MNRKSIDVVIYQVPKFEASPLATVRFTEYDGHGRAVKVNEVDYWEKEYFAPRPDSERLINAKLNARNLNIMRDWKECLHEYVDQYYTNYF